MTFFMTQTPDLVGGSDDVQEILTKLHKPITEAMM